MKCDPMRNLRIKMLVECHLDSTYSILDVSTHIHFKHRRIVYLRKSQLLCDKNDICNGSHWNEIMNVNQSFSCICLCGSAVCSDIPTVNCQLEMIKTYWNKKMKPTKNSNLSFTRKTVRAEQPQHKVQHS